MEFKAQDSTAFDDMLAFVKQHPDFEKLEISYEPTLSLSGRNQFEPAQSYQ